VLREDIANDISEALDAYLKFYDKLKKYEDGILGE
jgi:hypothetical protein